MVAVAVELLEGEGVAGFTTRTVAARAETSPPAVYEFFGDKAGLLREVFFEGFRMLRREFDSLTETDDPRADLIALAQCYRGFVRSHPTLAALMFERPFSDFDPGLPEMRAGSSVRSFIVGRVQRCLYAGVIAGDPTDVSLALLALIQGLASSENARRLGTTAAAVDRRWNLAMNALLDGLAG